MKVWVPIHYDIFFVCKSRLVMISLQWKMIHKSRSCAERNRSEACFCMTTTFKLTRMSECVKRELHTVWQVPKWKIGGLFVLYSGCQCHGGGVGWITKMSCLMMLMWKVFAETVNYGNTLTSSAIIWFAQGEDCRHGHYSIWIKSRKAP